MSAPQPEPQWQPVPQHPVALPASEPGNVALRPAGVPLGIDHQEPVATPEHTVHVYHHQPVSARHAHSLKYWLLLGWWWAPIKWTGRVALWVGFWPLGLWRSHRAAQRKAELKARRGQR